MIHNSFLGGGFGRRSINDEMRQAIPVAKAVGKPVKLVWTREEDMRHDRYRPQAAVRFKAGLRRRRHADGVRRPDRGRLDPALARRKQGRERPRAAGGRGLRQHPLHDPEPARRLRAQEHACAGDVLALGRLLAERVLRRELHRRDWRTPPGRTRYKFRRALLAGKSDFLGVLDMLAEKGDWGKPLPHGRGRGIAIHECYGSIVGKVAEVTVSTKGEVKVDRVVVAVDCGHVVNPGIVETQIEGGVIYGLSAALYGEITIKDGRVEQGNFDTYPGGAPGRRAEDRGLSRALRRQEMGRHRRARHGADRARGHQRDLRRHRQARAFAAAEEREAVGSGLKRQ